MKRAKLIELVQAAATAQGYAFHTGQEHVIGSTVRVYPAVWLAPPVLRARSGRTEGETTWRLVLHLMALPTAATATEAAWQRLESDALELLGSLALSTCTCAIDNVHCTPDRQSLTAHGETSVTLGCDITFWYID